MSLFLLVIAVIATHNSFAGEICSNLTPALATKFLAQGFKYQKSGELDSADLCAEALLKSDAHGLLNARSNNLKGLILLKRLKYKEAREHFLASYEYFSTADKQRGVKNLISIAETYKYEKNEPQELHYLELAQAQVTDLPLKSDIYVKKAWAYTHLNRHAEAQAAFETVIKMDLVSPSEKFDTYFGLINSLRIQNQDQQALLQIDQAIKMSKLDIELKKLHLLKGQIHVELKNNGSALQEFTLALELVPSDLRLNYAIYSGFMNCYAANKDYANFFLYADKVENTSYAPTEREKAGVNIAKGWVFLEKHDYKLSKKYFERALSIKSPEKFLLPAYFGLIEIYLRKKDLSEALPVYKDLITSGFLSKKETLMILKGYFAILSNLQGSSTEMAEALSEIQKYSKTYPTILISDPVWKMIGNLNLMDEQKIQKLIESGPADKAFAYFLWGVYYFKSDKLEKSKKNFEELLAINQTSSAALAGLENISASKGDNIQALRYYIKAKRLTDETRYNVIQNPLSRIYSNLKSELGSKKLATLIPIIGMIMPEYKRVVICTVALAYADQNRLPEANKYFQMAIDLGDTPDEAHPDWPYLGMGMVKSKEGHYDEAEKYFNIAIKRESNSKATWHLLGEHYLRLKSEKAESAFLKAVEPNKPSMEGSADYEEIEYEVVSSAFLHLGDIAVKGKHISLAKDYFSRALIYGLAEQKKEAQQKIKKLN